MLHTKASPKGHSKHTPVHSQFLKSVSWHVNFSVVKLNSQVPSQRVLAEIHSWHIASEYPYFPSGQTDDYSCLSCYDWLPYMGTKG